MPSLGATSAGACGWAADDRPGGLPAALERAAHDGGQRYAGDPLAGALGLLPPRVVEPRRRAGGRPARPVAFAVRPAVPHEDHGCHVGDCSGGPHGLASERDRRQRALPPGRPGPRGLRTLGAARAARAGDRDGRLRLDRAARAHRGGARGRRDRLRPAPPRRRGRRATPTSGPSSSATTTPCSSCSRRSGTSTRRTRSRPARSTSSSGADFVVTVRHGEGSRAALAPGASSSPTRACSPTAPRRSCTPSATGSSTATSRSSQALEVDVDEVEESVFSPARTNDSAPDLHAQARDRRGAPRGAAAARADAALRDRRRARHRAGGRALLPRRGRPPRPGRRRPSTPSTRCCPRPSTPTSPGSRCSRTRTCARSRPASAWSRRRR